MVLQQVVKFETKPEFCTKCKRIGHMVDDCKISQQPQMSTRRTRERSMTRKRGQSRGASQRPTSRGNDTPGTSGVKGTEAYMVKTTAAAASAGTEPRPSGAEKATNAAVFGSGAGNSADSVVSSPTEGNIVEIRQEEEALVEQVIARPDNDAEVPRTESQMSRPESQLLQVEPVPVAVARLRLASPGGSDMDLQSEQEELGPYLKDVMAAKKRLVDSSTTDRSLRASSKQVDIDAVVLKTPEQRTDLEEAVKVTPASTTKKGSATNYVMDQDIFRQKVWELVAEEERHNIITFLKKRRKLEPVCSEEELQTDGFIAKVLDLVRIHERHAFIARLEVLARESEAEESTEESDDSEPEVPKEECEMDWTEVGRGGRAKSRAKNGRRGRGGRGSQGRRGR